MTPVGHCSNEARVPLAFLRNFLTQSLAYRQKVLFPLKARALRRARPCASILPTSHGKQGEGGEMHLGTSALAGMRCKGVVLKSIAALLPGGAPEALSQCPSHSEREARAEVGHPAQGKQSKCQGESLALLKRTC